MKQILHFIAGKHVEGTSGRFGDIFNPATGEVQAKVALASRAEMRKAVEAALKVFPEWSAVNPQRNVQLQRYAITLAEYADWEFVEPSHQRFLFGKDGFGSNQRDWGRLAELYLFVRHAPFQNFL